MADKTVTYRLIADITAFKAQMGQAAASVQGAADRMTGATKQGVAFRNTLSTVGKVGGAVGLVAAAGLAVAVRAAANFDEGMSRVAAATHESAANMELLRAAALKAGADTRFSATEAATGVEALAKAGVSTKDILAGGLTGALNLAAAGSISVGDAAETAATAMTQFGLSGAAVPHVADLLAAAAGHAQGEVGDFGMALKQSGLVAAQMGVSIEEATGTLAAFASAGLIGSDAGTSFRTMLLRMANPSKQAAASMKELGINAYDAQGNLVSMSDLAGQLQVAFKGQSQATRDAALATIFGSDAIRAANVLYNQGSAGITDWTKKVNDSGYAAQTAAIKMDNLKGDLEQFKGSLETALIGTGEGSQGPLRALVQSLTGVVNAYNKLPAAAQGATGAFLGITAAAGGGLYVFSKIVTGVANTRQALKDLSATAGPLPPKLTAVAGAVTKVGTALAIVAVADQAFSLSTTATEIQRVTDVLDAGAGNSLADQIDATRKKITELEAELPKIRGFGGKAFGDAKLNLGITTLYPTDQAAKDAELIDGLKGHLDDLETQLQVDQLAAGDFGGSMGLLGDLIGTAVPPLGDVASAASKAAGGITDVGGAAGGATGQVNSFKAAMAGLSGFLDKRDAMRNYQASLDALGASIKQNGHTFDITTEKGRANQAALDGIASAAAKVADGLKGTNKTGFMKQAAADLRARAGQLHLTSDQIDEVIGRLKVANKTDAKPDVKPQGIPKANADINGVGKNLSALDRQKANPVVKVITDGASAAINAVLHQLIGLDNYTATPHVTTIYGHRGSPGAVTPAAGGYITGPGTATSDSIPAMVSNGEYVVKAAAVDKYGVDFLHQLNSMRYAMGGQVQFSRGGIVGAGSSQSSSGGTTVRIEGPLSIKGRLDLNTGQLMNATLEVVRQELSDDKSFDRAMSGRRS